MEMIKICAICGREFKSSPSDKKVTCSPECRKKYAAIRAKKRKLSPESRQKISEKARGRDMSELQAIGTRAAQESKNSGRFETNVNAIDWHLISPEGKDYYFHSLSNWLRENSKELFGCEPDTREWENVRTGLTGAKRAALGKNFPSCTYKGWQVIPTDSDNARMTR